MLGDASQLYGAFTLSSGAHGWMHRSAKRLRVASKLNEHLNRANVLQTYMELHNRWQCCGYCCLSQARRYCLPQRPQPGGYITWRLLPVGRLWRGAHFLWCQCNCQCNFGASATDGTHIGWPGNSLMVARLGCGMGRCVCGYWEWASLSLVLNCVLLMHALFFQHRQMRPTATQGAA